MCTVMGWDSNPDNFTCGALLPPPEHCPCLYTKKDKLLGGQRLRVEGQRDRGVGPEDHRPAQAGFMNAQVLAMQNHTPDISSP